MATMYWIGGTGDWKRSTAGHWSNTSGGVSNGTAPTSATDVIFDASSGAGSAVVTLMTNGANTPQCKSINTTGFTGTITQGDESLYVFGDANFTGITLSTAVYLQSTTTCAFTPVANTGYLVDISGAGTTTLQNDSLNCNLTCNAAFNANNHNLTIGTCNIGASAAVTMGSGTWTITGDGSAFSVNAAATITAGTSTVKFTGNSANPKAFDGAGKTYYNYWNATAGSGAVSITGANTFNDIKIDAGRTQKFTESTTTTVTTFTANGTAGNLITLAAVTPGTSFTLTKSGGGTISCSFMSISWSTATPAATWSAMNSTNGGNNSGWSFTSAGAFMMFF